MRGHAHRRTAGRTRSSSPGDPASSHPAGPGDSFAWRESGSNRVAIEHSHGIERILVQVVTDERQLTQYVAGCRNDVAADAVSLENIEHLARTCPHDLRFGARFEHLHGGCHERHRVYSGIGDATREHGDEAGDLGAQRGHDIPDLRQGHDCGDVELDPPTREAAYQGIAWLAARIRDRDLDVHVVTPTRNLERLAFHIRKLIADNLERQGFVPDL